VAGITVEILIFVWLGAFVGAFASGTAGFAFALTTSALWLHALDPIHTALLVVACSTMVQLATIWPMRQSIEIARVSPFIVAGLAGVPIGVWLLARTNPQTIKFVLGLFLAAYGVLALAAPRLPHIRAGGRAADAGIGFVSGILGGIGGYSGVLPTIWTQLRGWRKDVARAVYQPFILVMQVATLVLIGVVALDPFGVALIVAALPPLMAGAWLGWRAYGRLDERRFRQVIAGLLIASGVALVF
jgi:uncharacterized membrane protein YfcA